MENEILSVKSGSYSMQGKRPHQEDTVCNYDEKGFHVVFDGHGGDNKVSMYLKDNFFNIYSNKKGTITQRLESTFKKCEEDCIVDFDSGSTATISIIDKLNKKVYFGNLGDSRGVLVKLPSNKTYEYGVAYETKDHKPGRIDEKQRIEACGYVVVPWKKEISSKIKYIAMFAKQKEWQQRKLEYKYFKTHEDEKTKELVYVYNNYFYNNYARWFGFTNYSRSIGDKLHKKQCPGLISVVPEICKIPLASQNKFLVLASDGVWDTMTSKKATDIISYNREKSPGDIAETICEKAFEKGSTDNITATVVKIFHGD